jgi:hypothetical protein
MSKVFEFSKKYQNMQRLGFYERNNETQRKSYVRRKLLNWSKGRLSNDDIDYLFNKYWTYVADLKRPFVAMKEYAELEIL